MTQKTKNDDLNQEELLRLKSRPFFKPNLDIRRKSSLDDAAMKDGLKIGLTSYKSIVPLAGEDELLEGAAEGTLNHEQLVRLKSRPFTGPKKVQTKDNAGMSVSAGVAYSFGNHPEKLPDVDVEQMFGIKDFKGQVLGWPVADLEDMGYTPEQVGKFAARFGESAESKDGSEQWVILNPAHTMKRAHPISEHVQKPYTGKQDDEKSFTRLQRMLTENGDGISFPAAAKQQIRDQNIKNKTTPDGMTIVEYFNRNMVNPASEFYGDLFWDEKARSFHFTLPETSVGINKAIPAIVAHSKDYKEARAAIDDAYAKSLDVVFHVNQGKLEDVAQGKKELSGNDLKYARNLVQVASDHFNWNKKKMAADYKALMTKVGMQLREEGTSDLLGKVEELEQHYDRILHPKQPNADVSPKGVLAKIGSVLRQYMSH